MLTETQLKRQLVFMYHVIVASENLLKVAVSVEKDERLKAYFAAHLEEERDHDKWLADDLMSKGIDVKATSIPKLVVEMVGSVYYLIHHVDPAALLGYMAILENNAGRKDEVDELSKEHGSLLRTARWHIVHDVGHYAEVVGQIEKLPVRRQSAASECAAQTSKYLSRAAALIAKD
jgi:hypothetical protein